MPSARTLAILTGAIIAVGGITAAVLLIPGAGNDTSATTEAADDGADERARQAAEAAAGAASATVPPPTSTTPPLSPEQQALAEIGYTDPGSYTTLSMLCADLTADDTYLSPDHTLSPDQVREAQGMLIVCPQHPLAPQLRDAVTRGQQHADRRARGEIFYDGTHRVGAGGVQPGTYAIEGDISDCYWERTSASGDIIDNNFVVGARRVEVTVAGSDYSFHSDGCGEWRKVG